mgnify:CR=1 FL=1
MREPLVSIIVPARNAAAYIEETLRSILGQTLTDFEVLVVDEGSTDDTAAIVESFARSDPRIRLYSKEPAGPPFARNHALPHCRGKFVCALDSDDLWHPEKLAKQVAKIEHRPGSFVVTAFRRFVDEASGRQWTLSTTPAVSGRGVEAVAGISQQNSLQNYSGNTALMWTDNLRAVGGWSTVRSGEDWDLWLKMAAEFECLVIDQELQYYRKHSSSETFAQAPEIPFESHLKILRENAGARRLARAERSRAVRNKCLEFANEFRVLGNWRGLAAALSRGLFLDRGWASPRYLRGVAQQVWRVGKSFAGAQRA